jgi:hypothetical protein
MSNDIWKISSVNQSSLLHLKLDSHQRQTAQRKTRCLTPLVVGSGSLKFPVASFRYFIFLLTTTRCADANDGWHDGVRRDGGVCC